MRIDRPCRKCYAELGRNLRIESALSTSRRREFCATPLVGRRSRYDAARSVEGHSDSSSSTNTYCCKRLCRAGRHLMRSCARIHERATLRQIPGRIGRILRGGCLPGRAVRASVNPRNVSESTCRAPLILCIHGLRQKGGAREKCYFSGHRSVCGRDYDVGDYLRLNAAALVCLPMD